MDGDNALLPRSLSEFRSREFWDGFFKARGPVPFEWYGDWKLLKAAMSPVLQQPRNAILVVGCGNSELSAQMYAQPRTCLHNAQPEPTTRDVCMRL